LLAELDLAPNKFILATVHRDHNTDVPENLRAIFRAFLSAYEKYGLPVVLPLHPRTKKCIDTNLDPGLKEQISRGDAIRLIPPVGFLDMIALESNALLVATDSGGVQKEAFFCERPCIILRPETEWVELVEHGQAILVGANEDQIGKAFDQFIANGKPPCDPLYGDGHAANRICKELLDAFG